MKPISVEEITSYVKSHPECKGKTKEQIISIMQSDSEYINVSGDYQYSLFKLDRGGVGSWLFERESSVSPLVYKYVEGHDVPEGSADEIAAYNFLNNVFQEAKTSFDNQRKMEGWISDVVNYYRESFNKPATRARVEGALKDTREDLRNLDDVLHGRILYANDESEVEFAEMFRTTRGVKFSPQKIQSCQNASEEYLRADMINRGIDTVITNLNKNSQATTKFDRASRFNSSFIQAFNKLGIKDVATMNAFLAEVNEKYKDNPAVQNYGGGFRIVKLTPEEQEAGLYKSQYAIQRVIPTGEMKGEYAPMTAELEQLVAKELTEKLISVKAEMLGMDKGASAEDCQKFVTEKHKAYLSAFKDAYGTKELTTLSEQYISAQQQGVAYVNMGVSIAAMALAAFTGGLTSLAATGVAVLQPTQLLERGTDADGLTQDDLLNHGKMLLEQLPWMAVGFGVGKLGDMARSFVKLKGLQGLASKSGQSLDDFVKTMSTAGKLDTGVTKALGQTRLLAETAGVSTEFAIDMTTTLALRGDAATEDWVMSFAGALAGSAVNRKLSKMSSPQARVQHLMDTFKDFKLTEVEAKKILDAMEDSKPLKADYERLHSDVYKITPDTFLTGEKRSLAEKDLYNMFKDDPQFIEFLNSKDCYQFDQILVMYDKMRSTGVDPLLGNKIKSGDMKNTIQSRLSAAFEFEFNEKVTLIELLKSQGVKVNDGNFGYLFKDKEQISFVLDLLKNEDIRKQKFSPDVLSRLTPENLGTFNKLLNYSKLNKSNIRDYVFSMLLHQDLNFELVNKFLDDGVIDEKNYRNFWHVSLCKSKAGTDYISYLYDNSKNLFMNVISDMNTSSIEAFVSHTHNITPENISLMKKLVDIENIKPEELYTVAKLTSGKFGNLSSDEKLKLINDAQNLNPKIRNIIAENGYSITKLIEELSGVKQSVSISKNQQVRFVSAILSNNNTKAERVLSGFDFAQYGHDGIPLKYSRNDFINNVNEILKELPAGEKNLILAHFGLDSKFDGLINNRPFNEQNISLNGRQAAYRVLSEIENFTTKNETTIDNLEVKAILDDLVKGLPEFTSVIGKIQHTEHAYSVDIHMLKVLQSVINDPDYKKLSDSSKTVLKFASILHDIGKSTGVDDPKHIRTSSQFMYSILDKFNLSDDAKTRIIDLVDNHHWFGDFNTGKLTAEQVAAKMRNPEDFMIYKIMAKADSTNVNGNFYLSRTGTHTQQEFDNYINEKTRPIEAALEKMYETAPLIMDSKFTNNGAKFPTQRVMIDGDETELRVLNVSELQDGASLEAFGFASGTTKENAVFNIHMTNELENTWDLLNSDRRLATDHPMLSSSIVRVSDIDDRGTYGFVLNTDNQNLVIANRQNFVSGEKKSLGKNFSMLFNDGIIGATDDGGGVTRIETRDLFLRTLREKTGIELTNSEYAQLLKDNLISKKYITQINDDVTISGKTIKAEDLRAVLQETTAKLIDTRIINTEVTQIDPKITALVAKVEKLEDCSPEFLAFAKKHNLSIIILNPNKVFAKKSQINPKWTSKYTSEENAYIAQNAEKLYDFVIENSEQVFADYAELGVSDGSSRIKTFLGVHEKIYRSLDRIDKKIEELSDVDKYNAEKLKPGDEPLTQEMADAKIEKYNIDKYNLIHDFDSVYDTLQDVFGGRMIMDNASDIDKVFQSLLDAIDKGDMEILEINNYQGVGGVPYFSSEQIMQIKQHCHNKGYEVTINSQVKAPEGLEKTYEKKFHSVKAMKKSGYTTCQMNIKHKNGVISEYQIRGKHINDLAESEHIYYDLSQGKDPSKDNPKVKELLAPLKAVIDKMAKNEKNDYSEYLTEYYKYARMKELGIAYEKPKLPAGIDTVLDMDNIIALHKKIVELQSK